MTFEQFQATRQESDDLGAIVPDYADYGDGTGKKSGFVYAGSLCIERVTAEWPAAARNEGSFYLLLNRDEYISNDLADLEQKLFDYAEREGCL